VCSILKKIKSGALFEMLTPNNQQYHSSENISPDFFSAVLTAALMCEALKHWAVISLTKPARHIRRNLFIKLDDKISFAAELIGNVICGGREK
jgi:hypothetical protein